MVWVGTSTVWSCHGKGKADVNSKRVAPSGMEAPGSMGLGIAMEGSVLAA